MRRQEEDRPQVGRDAASGKRNIRIVRTMNDAPPIEKAVPP